jgi:hypothetical protein
MIIYENEINVKVWLNHGSRFNPTAIRVGHTAATIRTLEGQDISAAYMSWWPADDDLNTHKKSKVKDIFRTRTAAPVQSYESDRINETSDSARDRYNIQREITQKAEQTLELFLSQTSYSDQMVYAHAAQNKLMTDITSYKSSSSKYLKRLGECYEYYILPILKDLTKRGNQTIHLDLNAVMPPWRNQDDFQLRSNQKLKNDDLITMSDEKRSIPGMYSKVCFKRSSGGKLTNNQVDQALIDRIEGFVHKDKYAYWGLNLTAIAKAWRVFLRSDTHGYKYASTSRNCSGVIWEMLIAGGIDCFIEPKKQRLFRTPAEVHEAVANLADTLLLLNKSTLEFLEAADVSVLFADNNSDLVPSVGAGSQADLMSLETFKSISRSPNRLALRREQVGAIDSYLRSYHAARWDGDNKVKLKYLVRMFEQILEHRSLKPQSDRRKGVDILGVQILKLIQTDITTRATGTLGQAILDANQTMSSRAVRERALKK